MNTFAQDILEGLRRIPKRLPSKYFYDETGDRLFQQIMHLPEYYLTRCETEILETHKDALLQAIVDRPFDLVELGAGDGLKTKILLQHFWQHGADFRYAPVDISAHVLQLLETDVRAALPQLEIISRQGDYFKNPAAVMPAGERRKLVLFLGSNIGNYTQSGANELLQRIAAQLRPGDRMLTGFDLKKEPSVVLAAYNDAAGVTRDFNLNLLRRINRELGGNFDLNAFMHWPTYNPQTGDCKSYLLSKSAQTVHLASIGEDAHFGAWEAVQTELSRKYDLDEIENLCEQTGFRVREHYLDSRRYFADSLWERM